MVPRHIRNIIIAALLVLLAVTTAVNAYVHYQFKSNIDRTLKSVQAFAQIKYSELSTSSFSSEVKLKNVRISAAFLPEEIPLGDVTLETPGFSYIFNGQEKMNKGEFPQHFGFSLNNFYFDLSGETAARLDKLVNRMQPLYTGERKICGGKSIFGPSDYKEMGYARLLSNIRIAYDFNDRTNTLNVDMTAGTRNMAKINARFSISGIRAMSSAAMKLGAKRQKLRNVEITYKDETYAVRFVKYCSALDKTKEEDFIDAETKQPDEYFYKIWGFAPGKGLRDAYKDFLLKPDLVTLTMMPGKEFQPMTIMSLSGSEMIDALNVKLKINGLAVNDLSYKTPSAKFTEKFKQQRANSINFDSLLRGEPITEPTVIEQPKITKQSLPGYHPISLVEAKQHIGDYVRITTLEGHKRAGRLLKMNNQNLYVQKKVSGGKFTMTVPLDKIKTIEVYFAP